MRLTVSLKVSGSGPMTFLSGLNTVNTNGVLNCVNSGLTTGHTDSRKLILRLKKRPDETDLPEPQANSVILSCKFKSTGCLGSQWNNPDLLVEVKAAEQLRFQHLRARREGGKDDQGCFLGYSLIHPVGSWWVLRRRTRGPVTMAAPGSDLQAEVPGQMNVPQIQF